MIFYELSNLRNITPGDFKVVLQKMIFMDQGIISNIMIINTLKEESKIKMKLFDRKIGFV